MITAITASLKASSRSDPRSSEQVSRSGSAIDPVLRAVGTRWVVVRSGVTSNRGFDVLRRRGERIAERVEGVLQVGPRLRVAHRAVDGVHGPLDLVHQLLGDLLEL